MTPTEAEQLKSYSIQVGERFGRWTVISAPVKKKMGEGRNANYPVFYLCRCDCGAEREVRAFKLLSNSRSCGCGRGEAIGAAHTTHGMSGGSRPRIYRVWDAMIQRCHNPAHSGFAAYGGRGITVCDEWRGSFVAFRDWAMASGYSPHLEIDRIDNNQGYRPDNCRWVTSGENKRNTRKNRFVMAFGEEKCMEDWSLDPRCQVTPSTIRYRMQQLGWAAEDAISRPRLSRGKSPRYAGTNAYRQVKQED